MAYRYRPDDLGGPAVFSCRALYVVGGLYGNLAALDAVLRRAAAEPIPPKIVFNGDFHYLDADPETFAAIAAGVLAHRASLGNVEYALTAPNADIGCGCDYPDYISDAVVERSNRIVSRLRRTAAAFPSHLAALAALPRHLTIDVAGYRVGIVHGDPESVAGWKLALEAIEPADPAVREHTRWAGAPTTTATLSDWFRRGRLDVLASTHTGLAYAQDLSVDNHPRLVINNGSAGLGNFHDTAYGVLTRIAADTAEPPDSLYGHALTGRTHTGLRCDAIPVHYDLARATRSFLTTWPTGSAGHTGYYNRLTHGSDLHQHQAARFTREGP
jgi:hypothetical protein